MKTPVTAAPCTDCDEPGFAFEPSVKVFAFAVSVSTGASLTGVTVTVLTSAAELSEPSFTVKLMLRELPGLSEVLMNMTARKAFCHWVKLAPLLELRTNCFEAASKAVTLMSPMVLAFRVKFRLSPLTKPLVMVMTALFSKLVSASLMLIAAFTVTALPFSMNTGVVGDWLLSTGASLMACTVISALKLL